MFKSFLSYPSPKKNCFVFEGKVQFVPTLCSQPHFKKASDALNENLRPYRKTDRQLLVFDLLIASNDTYAHKIHVGHGGYSFYFFSLVNLIFNRALQCYCSSADQLAPYRKDHPKLIKVEHSWVSERQPAKDGAKRLNSH